MANGPPFISDEVINELLVASLERTDCVRVGSRRYCCSYHEGFGDALGEAQAWQERHA